MALHDCGAVSRFKNCGQHAERSRFAGSIGAKQAINLARLGYKTNVVHGPNFAAFLVVEVFGQTASFNHRETSQARFGYFDRPDASTKEGAERLQQNA